jgi:hypothetical protein
LLLAARAAGVWYQPYCASPLLASAMNCGRLTVEIANCVSGSDYARQAEESDCSGAAAPGSKSHEYVKCTPLFSCRKHIRLIMSLEFLPAISQQLELIIGHTHSPNVKSIAYAGGLNSHGLLEQFRKPVCRPLSSQTCPTGLEKSRLQP